MITKGVHRRDLGFASFDGSRGLSARGEYGRAVEEPDARVGPDFGHEFDGRRRLLGPSAFHG